MRDWVDRALILRIGHFREIDLWVRMLVQGTGLITAFAFGGVKSRRRFVGCLDQFNTIACRLKQSLSGYYTLEEASLIKGAGSLRCDFQHTGMAVNCTRFLEVLGVSTDDACEIFALMQDVCLALQTPVPALFPLFFRYHLACRLGYAPELAHCGLCGCEPKDAWFMLREGYVACTGCVQRYALARERRLILPEKCRERLCELKLDLPSLWAGSQATKKEFKEEELLVGLIDGFVREHLGIIWDKGRFRRI